MAYLAIDLGAGSGRVIAGTISGGRLVLDELHRFPNVPVYRDGMLCWDFSRLFGEIERGIRTACEKDMKSKVSVSIPGVWISLWWTPKAACSAIRSAIGTIGPVVWLKSLPGGFRVNASTF